MKKLIKPLLFILVMAISVISCRENTSETNTESNNADVKIKVDEDGDVKKKIETENKEVKVKIDEDGNKKKKVDYND